jgi:hypothetical protein
MLTGLAAQQLPQVEEYRLSLVRPPWLAFPLRVMPGTDLPWCHLLGRATLEAFVCLAAMPEARAPGHGDVVRAASRG